MSAFKDIFKKLGTVDNTRAVLSYALLITFVGILFKLIATPDLGENVKDPILVLLGILAGSFKDIFGYYFGSSDGSKQKTKLFNGGSDV